MFETLVFFFFFFYGEGICDVNGRENEKVNNNVGLEQMLEEQRLKKVDKRFGPDG